MREVECITPQPLSSGLSYLVQCDLCYPETPFTSDLLLIKHGRQSSDASQDVFCTILVHSCSMSPSPSFSPVSVHRKLNFLLTTELVLGSLMSLHSAKAAYVYRSCGSFREPS